MKTAIRSALASLALGVLSAQGAGLLTGASSRATAPGGAKTVNVNFGGTAYTGTGAASDTGTTWTTTWAPDPSGRHAGNPDLRSLPSSDGRATCFALDHNYAHTGTYGSPGIDLFASYLHNHSEATNLTLSGLHSASSYNLFFYGARDGLDETLRVTVGGLSKTMITKGNTGALLEDGNYLRFEGVVPDVHGEVAVTLGGGAATVNLLCGLQVEEVGPVARRQRVPKRDFVRRLRMGENLTFTFLGTSLTNGTWKWVETFGEWLEEEFPGQTKRLNHGWGATATSEPVGLPYGMRRLRPALDANPDVLFIEFAMNDAHMPYGISIEQSRVNLEGIIDAVLRGHPDREVVIVTTNPCTPGTPGANDRPQLRQYYELFRTIADERQLLVIDHYWGWQKILKEDPALFRTYIPDGVHPQYPGLRAVTKPEYQRSLLGGTDGIP